MNVFLKFRERIATLSHPLLLEFEQLLTVIRTTFRAEHNDDGTHGAVTASTIVSGQIDASGVRVGEHLGLGYVRLVQGTATRPGYIDWRLADDTRLGYLGWGTTNVELNLENGAFFAIIGGATELTEQSDPSAPSTNKARLYARDNGSGKTQLCVRFATGAIQVLATEP